MKHYRVYKLARRAGGILKGKDVLADNDGAAMAAARDDEDCPICEVWQGTKKVGLVDE